MRRRENKEAGVPGCFRAGFRMIAENLWPFSETSGLPFLAFIVVRKSFPSRIVPRRTKYSFLISLNVTGKGTDIPPALPS